MAQTIKTFELNRFIRLYQISHLNALLLLFACFNSFNFLISFSLAGSSAAGLFAFDHQFMSEFLVQKSPKLFLLPRSNV